MNDMGLLCLYGISDWGYIGEYTHPNRHFRHRIWDFGHIHNINGQLPSEAYIHILF